ncbi:MAG: nuclear transport factor 2 family protein [Pseudomonadota bacterium]|nr:nuclear transport factor 2 family protein [Pseudomonadota bacterium]
MSTEENIELAEKVLGNGLDILEFLAEDAVWVIPGLATYRGKQEIDTKLLEPTRELMESMGTSVITNIVAQGNAVVVESYANDRTTKTGRPYNNTYCHVYTVIDHLIHHVTEYADTALAKKVFSS